MTIGSRYVPGGGIEGWPLKRQSDEPGGEPLRPLAAVAEAEGLQRRLSLLPHGNAAPSSTSIGSSPAATRFRKRFFGCCGGLAAASRETPIIFADREKGSSKINSKEAVNALRIIFRLGLQNMLGRGRCLEREGRASEVSKSQVEGRGLASSADDKRAEGLRLKMKFERRRALVKRAAADYSRRSRSRLFRLTSVIPVEPDSMKTSVRIYQLIAVVVCTGLASAAIGKSIEFDLTLRSKHDAQNVPVTVPIQLTGDIHDARHVVITNPAGTSIAAELTDPGLVGASSESRANRSAAKRLAGLHFVLPAIKAGESMQLHGAISDAARDADPTAVFHWNDVPKEHNLLSFASRPVLDLMCRPLDESSKAAREETFKPFHHLYDPDGKILVTKGPGGYFTHHRGLFYGFNKITYGNGKQADVWHCTNNCYQSFEKVLDEAAGQVLGRQDVAIDWHGQDRKPFAHEQREMTVYNVLGGTMIDFASRLETAGESVRLDGDPQHSGFHFRAANEVAEKGKPQIKNGKATAEKINPETVFIRTDGVGKPGDAINWDPKMGAKNDPRTINQPWKGMSFMLGDQRYTVAILDLPTNPKEARFSERDYGRFGSYFEYDLTKDHPLEIRYRVWLQKGMMTPEQIAALAADFADPVEATVKLAAK